jgi:hypothetical protein
MRGARSDNDPVVASPRTSLSARSCEALIERILNGGFQLQYVAP